MSVVDVGSLTTCAICFDTFNTPIRLGCNHIFCANCWDQTRKHNSACPMCRKPHCGPGTHDAVMSRLVCDIPRRQPCGQCVTKANLEAHEQHCGLCASVTKKELKDMVYRLVKRVRSLQKERQLAVQAENRARCESKQYCEQATLFEKRLRDRELRARRRLFREKKREKQRGVCDDSTEY